VAQWSIANECGRATGLLSNKVTPMFKYKQQRPSTRVVACTTVETLERASASNPYAHILKGAYKKGAYTNSKKK